MQNPLLKNKKTLAVLDLGSTKVSCMIAECDMKTDAITVLGVGQYASKGIKNNIIVDMEAFENSILSAVHAAEKTAGHTINDVVANISGDHLLSEIFTIRLKVPNRPITDDDLNQLINQVTDVDENKDFEVIHATPLSYTIDGRKGIQDPRGMMGNDIICLLHVITASKGPVQTLVNCIHRCHLNLQALVCSPIASGYATLGEDEMELGVTLIDLGGGCTDIAMFAEGQIVHVDFVSLGGKHVSSDISQGLSVSLAEAERLKTLYGNAMHSMTDDHVTFQTMQLGDEKNSQGTILKKKSLVSIIQPRLEETFERIKDRLGKSNMHIIAGKRIVLTGGASQMPGIKDLATQILGQKVRLGKPIQLPGLPSSALNPSFSTCIGLLLFVVKHIYKQPDENHVETWFESVKIWIKDLF